MTVILFGLALVAALLASVLVSSFDYDSLSVPSWLSPALWTVSAALALGFLGSLVRELRPDRGT